jgi:hypothetical protein
MWMLARYLYSFCRMRLWTARCMLLQSCSKWLRIELFAKFGLYIDTSENEVMPN